MAKGPKKVLWGKEYLDNIRYHEYNSIINNPRAMYDWINGKKYSCADRLLIEHFVDSTHIYRIVDL